MSRSIFHHLPLIHSRPLLVLGVAALLCNLSAASLRAQGSNSTGATMTLSGWMALESGNSAGTNTASNSSLVIGGWNTVDNFALALGVSNTVSGYSLAVGDTNSADGTSFVSGALSAAGNVSGVIGHDSGAANFSFATGDGAYANNTSVATGALTLATGYASHSAGYSTTAQSYASFVVGRFNKTSSAYDPNNWAETDPLFVVGNGTGDPNAANEKRDAFVVYKNGNVKMSKAQGDISMGSFQ